MPLAAKLRAFGCVIAVAMAAVAFGGASAAGQDPRAVPEAATGWFARNLAVAKRHMVAAANPYAAEAASKSSAKEAAPPMRQSPYSGYML